MKIKWFPVGGGVLAAIFYGITSTAMTFLNKAVVNSYEFNFPFFIMACQMLVTVIIIEILSLFGKITLPPYNWKAAWAFFAPSLGYACHSTLSLMALKGLNIPMYTAVKRCSPLVNLILAVIILKKPMPSCTLTSCILVISVGCIIAALGDMTFDGLAYTMGGMSVLAQGIYLTLVQKCSENHLSTLEILQLNSYNTLAPFVILSVIIGEPEAILKNPYILDPGFHITFLVLVSLGVVLNYSLFLCTALTSALTTSLVAVAKSVIQTLIGFFVFGGVRYHPLNMLGILLNMMGGFLYTYLKLQEGRRKSVADDHMSSKVHSKLEEGGGGGGGSIFDDLTQKLNLNGVTVDVQTHHTTKNS